MNITYGRLYRRRFSFRLSIEAVMGKYEFSSGGDDASQQKNMEQREREDKREKERRGIPSFLWHNFFKYVTQLEKHWSFQRCCGTTENVSVFDSDNGSDNWVLSQSDVLRKHLHFTRSDIWIFLCEYETFLHLVQGIVDYFNSKSRFFPTLKSCKRF